MDKAIKHSASIETLHWQDVRDNVAKVQPELAKIIDEIDPGKEFLLFKARYPFGARIAHQGRFYFPTNAGTVEAIESPNVTKEIKEHFHRRDLPISLMLDKSAEIYYDMPDRIISRHLIVPGGFFGLWGQFDEVNTDYIKWIWSLTSGARSLYFLPRMTNATGHKQLQRKYQVHSNIPKNQSDNWKLFAEIANSPNFTEEWHSTWLFFADIWIETALKDKKWRKFYDYLFQTAWKESQYWRNKNTFELIWESFVFTVANENIKPNLFLACIIKQLILTGIGVLPGYTVTTDDSIGPISSLQNVIVNDYDLQEYIPIFLQPHIFSKQDKHATYYSLQYPNLLETIPTYKRPPSILSSIPDLRKLMEIFRDRSINLCIAENTPIDIFCKNVDVSYFHCTAEHWNSIRGASELVKEDDRLLPISKHTENNKFPSSSLFLAGCVRFTNLDNQL